MSDAALLVENVRRSVAGTLDVLGYIGNDASRNEVLLARELATKALVAIAVTVNANDPTQFTVDVQRTLNKTVAVSGSRCPECRTPLPEIDAFCFHCGADLYGAVAAIGSRDSEIVLRALGTATAGRYEVLGRMDREGGTSAVYFARDLANGQIVALRLKRVDAIDAAEPEYVQRLIRDFDTAELQAKIAQQKVQQDAERVAAERVAAERVATERAVAERAAAERAAAERAATERAAAERAAAERAVAERAAAERAAAERAAADRVAAERAAAERAAAERAAAERAAAERVTAAAIVPVLVEATPPYVPDAPTASAEQFAAYDAASAVASDGTHAQKPKSSRMPLMAGAAVAVLAILGYFGFRGSSTPTPVVPTTVATAPIANDSSNIPPAAPPPVDSAPPTPVATTPAAVAPTSATAATAAISADSGIIRISGIPADARVTVDGRATRGRVLRVTARAHQLVVTAKGFDPYTEKLTIAAGATLRWAPKLVAVAVVAAAPAKSVQPAPAATNAAAPVNKKSCHELVRVEDWSTAEATCTTEANAGSATAASSLGHMYLKGLGVTRDPAQSVTWYKKGAAAGDHDAQLALGYALRDGNGVKHDDKESAQMFKLAAEGGDKAAQLEYAVALEKGDGLKKDQPAAREWYKKAADQGISMAARRLGRMYEKGDGGPKSEPDAIAAYERAATLGDAESAMTAGKWYRDGKGVTASPAQALTWFKKALELGNKDAQNEIRKLQK